MRYSDEKKFSVKLVAQAKRSVDHQKLFDRVARDTKEDDRLGMILLAGGNSPADIAVRTFQAVYRYDRLPSFWSQAALILQWPDGATPDEVIGVEIPNPLDTDDDVVPERCGARLFRLSKYMNRERYRNLGLGAVRIEATAEKRKSMTRKELLERAALTPARAGGRYRFWDWLGQWTAHCMNGNENPLLLEIPHPGAAFCEYVFGEAGFDISPGLDAPGASPESIWNALLFWHNRFRAEEGELLAWASIDREESPSRSPLSIWMELPKASPKRGSKASSRSKGAGAPSKKKARRKKAGKKKATKKKS